MHCLIFFVEEVVIPSGLVYLCVSFHVLWVSEFSIGALYPAIVPAEIHQAASIIDFWFPSVEMRTRRVRNVFNDDSGPLRCLELPKISPMGWVFRVRVPGNVLQVIISGDRPFCDWRLAIGYACSFEGGFLCVPSLLERVTRFTLRRTWRQTERVR